ncbi:hypothetical protein [Actinomadura rayongensis]|uniref:hypothetical protein n=1 Tax=Actinomadura rayongensis TaxID=1429076 RepID=UPI0013681A1E|nr:hypothetical protein [Actinomadura rayongensis]
MNAELLAGENAIVRCLVPFAPEQCGSLLMRGGVRRRIGRSVLLGLCVQVRRGPSQRLFAV